MDNQKVIAAGDEFDGDAPTAESEEREERAYRMEQIRQAMARRMPAPRRLSSDDFIPMAQVAPNETSWYEC